MMSCYLRIIGKNENYFTKSIRLKEKRLFFKFKYFMDTPLIMFQFPASPKNSYSFFILLPILINHQHDITQKWYNRIQSRTHE
jgi:hypothetical protein